MFDDGTGPALYVEGTFATAGGVPAKSLARWNGSSWSALPSELDDKFPGVSALASFDAGLGGGPRLFAGGSFSGAGGLSTGNVAMWNGTTWSKPGLGITGEVYALSVADLGGGPALYAGGFFPVPGFGLSKNIARWNGLAWAPLGSGTGSAVYALSSFDDGQGDGPVLCAGGFFDTAGGQSAQRIARWNGAAWSPFDSGVGVGLQSTKALSPFDDDLDGVPALYAGGDFTIAGGLDSNRIARWGCAVAEPCDPADLSCDGVVDGSDLGLLLAAWGPCPKVGSCDADLDGDGQVGGGDLGGLLAAWSAE